MAQIRLQTWLIDDFHDIGQMRLFWNAFGTKTWSWQYSPDGPVTGVWSWVPWVFPPVETADGKKIYKNAAWEKFCMVLTRIRYASADDAILHPMNMIKGTYAILYGGWGDGSVPDSRRDPRWPAQPPVSEPPARWFMNEYIDLAPAPRDVAEDVGSWMGEGLGLFDLKQNSYRNPITHEKVDNWPLPPQGARTMFWASDEWSPLTDPFSQLVQDDFFVKRTGWVEEKNKEKKRGSLNSTFPPGYNPGRSNFGPSRPPPSRGPFGPSRPPPPFGGKK